MVTKQIAKEELAKMGIKVFIKDMKSIKMISVENIGHMAGWTKNAYSLELKDGRTFTFISEPTGIYSGKRQTKVVM